MQLQVSSQRRLLILVCLYVVFSFSVSSLFPFFTFSDTHQPAKFLLGLFSIISFLLPAWIVQKLFSSKTIFSLAVNQGTWRFQSIILSISAIICSVIVMNWLSNLNQQIPVPDSLSKTEIAGMEQQLKYMKAGSFWQICYNLFIFSLIPSVCEEAFFRGTMQPLWEKVTQRKWLAILITAIIFSFFHFQISGFLPRLFAGIILGIIFSTTRNIFIPIICHFIYNSFVVIVSIADQYNNFDLAIFEKKLLNPYLVASAILLVVFFLYQLYKKNVTKRIRSTGSVSL